MKAFELYRFVHADGTAKDWAYCDLGNGQAEIRWGREGQLHQSQVQPVRVAQGRSEEKRRKGYRYVGTAVLDAQGTRLKDNVPAGPVFTSKPAPVNPVNLSAILGEGDGFYF